MPNPGGADASPAVVEAPEVVVASSKLKWRDDLRYFEGKPFTGVAVEKYKNGQKSAELNYKAGKMHGLHTGWHENGQKKKEINYKDGKRDGLRTGWHENGQKREEGNFKGGKLMTSVVWKPNGKKCPHTNLADGNGIVVWYKMNGTEGGRTTFKDGEEVR